MSQGDVLSVFFVALSLSADCFAVALGSSLGRHLKAAQILRGAFSFGLFQAGMCIAGWFAGKTVLNYISGIDHWVAFGLLAAVGGHMIWESIHREGESRRDITQGWHLIILSIATSIDSLAVGLSYGVLQSSISLVALIIGLTAFIVSIVGFKLGRKVAEIIGHRAELIGSIVLIIIGLKILVDHFLA